MRVVVSGASGFVGRPLVASLRADGHDVVRLVRRAASAPDEIRWSPGAGSIDADALEGADAVVHLAGESIGARRWNAEHKRRVLDSRVRGTSLLAGAVASLRRKPAAFVSASGVGFYGDTGGTTVDESAPKGTGFLSDVVAEWEAATAPASAAGIRVVLARAGVVLGSGGGALSRMLLPFRLGIGGRLGSGQQWFSWISMHDHIRALHFALEADLAGPVNFVSPGLVTNREFTRAVGRVLRRPTVIPTPAPLLRVVLGREMADELLLAGQRAEPAALRTTGFRFDVPAVEDALRAAVAR